MSTYTTAIKFDPKWSPPDEDEIDATPIDDKFRRRIENFHVGLKSITLTPMYREDGRDMTCTSQRFIVKGGAKNKQPGIAVDQLARLMTAYGQEICDELDKGELTCRCIFYGDSEELGGSFQHGRTFRVQPSEEEDSSTPISRPVDSPERSPARVVSAIPRAVGTPMSAAVESETVQMLRSVHEGFLAVAGELKAGIAQLRSDFSAGMRAQGEAWQMFATSSNNHIDRLGDELHDARVEATRANERLIKMSEQYASQQDGEKKILQYAMNMFLESMKTQWGAMSREMSWERQIMYQQFDALAQQYKKDGRQEWLKEYSPLLLAVAGQAMEKFGSKAQGQFLQQIAAGVDEEEEEEEETPAPRPPRPSPPQRPTAAKKTSVMGVPVGVDPAAHLQQNPVASIFQLFGSLVKAEPARVEAVQAILGDTYTVFDQATAATDDAQARAYGVRFMTSLTQDGLRKKLEEVLDEEQRELLSDIQKQLFGTAPQTSIPKDSASVAELRTFAKTTYNLTFPVGTSKKDMLTAIKEKATN